MALVREPMVYDGFDAAAEASAFDALLDVDAAALFGGAHEPAGASSGLVLGSANWAGAGASVLPFDRAARGHGAAQAAAAEKEECDAWIDAMDQSYGAAATHHATASIGFDAATGCLSLTERAGGVGRPFGLLFPSTSCGSPDAAAPVRGGKKRPYAGAEPQAISPTKKQCGASRKTSKAKSTPTTPPKDPQSLAAKNRRERISERLRILQELVPNGTKVDLVTMLEKAIGYVKFLQLQVKVLATDEFWPAQGGKPPKISQVKEALDAILSSSQRGQLN